MASLQEVFDGCRVLYQKCFNNVKAMSCEIAAYMESKGEPWDPKVTAGKFDIVLQYSLLQIAASDFDLDKNELIFIRDLTEQGDFVNYINSIAHTQITWEGIFDSSITEFRKFLRGVENLIENLSMEFVNVFAICDKVTEYNYVADLEKNIALIFAGLMTMDECLSNSELEQDTVMNRAINKIKELKK